MIEDRHRQRLMIRRRTVVAAGALLVGIGGVGLGVVTTASSASTGSAAAISYCSASRSVDEYRGHDHAHLGALLDRVQRRAPSAIAPIVGTMRMVRTTSAALSAAKSTWDHYNTNHCCTCIGSSSIQLASNRP